MSVTVTIARDLLNGKLPNPGTPGKGELFLSFLVVKNLADLCETGRSILIEMRDLRRPMDGLPNQGTLQMIQNILNQFYSSGMFLPNDEYGQLPIWSVINKFNKADAKAAYQLYTIIKGNVKSATEMPKALSRRDKKFFLENIDEVFADIPFKDLINQFKNFIASKHVPEDSQELVWGYFEALIGIFVNEEDHIKTIEKF